MTAREAVSIEVSLNDVDDGVLIEFRWDCWDRETFPRTVYVSRTDGKATLILHTADARELHRLLGVALDTAHDAAHAERIRGLRSGA
ncbi:hypothetical protein LCGC14_1278280 [marine sediment metagenome]|uniref:Uncharacterized protein n=1 Tax=marine sediment metagenome TaxID=412755 RepID=A0A0F9NCN4_9ZZZZ